MLKLKYMFENFPLAKEALKHYAHDTQNLDKILSRFRISANAVYPFFCEGKLCFLRLAPVEEKKLSDILGELEFIRYLRSCGYPAMEPIQTLDGNYCKVLDTQWGSYYASAFRCVSGKPVEDTGMEDGVLYEYGAALGKLHALSENFVPAVKKRSYKDVLQSLHREFAADDVPERMRRELAEVSAALETLPKKAETFGLVHYDFEPDNVFWDAGNMQCSVIDFDDGMYHWFALDVEQVFDSLTEHFEKDALENARTRFLEGYRCHHAFSSEMERSLPLMRRFINLYSYARLRHCLSEPVSDQPDWMVYLEKRLRQKMAYLESLIEAH